MSRFQTGNGERLHWRAIVRTTGTLESRQSHSLSWHLVECEDPTRLDAHCPVGAQLLSAGADPDGHCMLNGQCPRCAPASASAPAAPAPQPTVEASEPSPEPAAVPPIQA